MGLFKVSFLCFGLIAAGAHFASSANLPKKTEAHQNVKLWAHMKPWFDTPKTSGNGSWGIHWTMATRKPDNIVNGKRDIASHFYPLDDVYGSGDFAVIERQFSQMRYAGINGILLDWPGTLQAFDYPKNLRNSEAIVSATAKFGLEFAIVYEDHNIGLAFDKGFIPDKLAAARRDMIYLQNQYFHLPNYIKIDGRPLLLVFGPQTFKSPNDWNNIFSVFNPKPQFYTLWNQMQQAAGNAVGEFSWIDPDFTTSLTNFYQHNPAPQKIGGAYPGFHSFYKEGGWPGPTWQLPYNNTFQRTLQLALDNGMKSIQLNTWNDWGEGTMIEPSKEFGHSFLDILQKTFLPQYSTEVFDVINDLYERRIEFSTQMEIQSVLDEAADALINLEPEKAASILATIE